MFSSLAVLYLFLGGAGAGAATVLCVLECLDAQRHQGQERRALTVLAGLRGMPASGNGFAPRLPRNFYARTWPIALAALGAGALCLLCDLGRPERIVELVLTPHPSAMAVGAFALTATLAVSAGFTALSLFEGLDVHSGVVRAFGVVGISAGLVTMLYTGVLLQGMASVLFWQTPLLPTVFLLSSLSCGIACVLVGLAFTESRRPLTRHAVSLTLLDSAVIVLEALALAALVGQGLLDEGARSSVDALLTGDLRGVFWAGVVGLGLVVPFAVERLAPVEWRRFQLLWAGGLVLAGGLALRWCIVAAGSYDVAQAVGVLAGIAGALW